MEKAEARQERGTWEYVNHTRPEVISAFVFFFHPLEKKLPGLPFFFSRLSLHPFSLLLVLFVIPSAARDRHRAINFPRTKRTKFKKVPASMFPVTRATDNINEPILTTMSRRSRAPSEFFQRAETRKGVLSFRDFHDLRALCTDLDKLWETSPATQKKKYLPPLPFPFHF